MNLKRFVVLLLAVTLITGNPALASAFAFGQGCATATEPASDDGGCCGALGKATCSTACPMTPAAAAVSMVVSRLKPTAVPLSFVPATGLAGLVAGPPDTAPPKFTSA